MVPRGQSTKKQKQTRRGALCASRGPLNSQLVSEHKSADDGRTHRAAARRLQRCEGAARAARRPAGAPPPPPYCGARARALLLPSSLSGSVARTVSRRVPPPPPPPPPRTTPRPPVRAPAKCVLARPHPLN